MSANTSTIDGSAPALDASTQLSIGSRLEVMYHVAASMHELCERVIDAGDMETNEPIIIAIREMAKGQARDLSTISERLTGEHTGYYESQFE